MASTSGSPRFVALIPARSGSKRVVDKNVRRLAGHPVIAYTIASALECGLFADVIVSTDSETYAAIARHYGASVPFLRPAAMAGDTSPDIEWVEHAIGHLTAAGSRPDGFALLRPTSPFRRAATIARAWAAFHAEAGADSLRAVELCKQHPGKMWVVRGRRMFPLLPIGPKEQPWHSSQYPTLPEVYIQNASLEIASSRVIFENRTIAGDSYVPFISEGDEGYDVNDVADWVYAEYMLANGEASLPPISRPPFPVDA
jgi:CMP-N,N'-diacetyllegionaminic acid synthase